MNPGAAISVLLFCILPPITISLAFVAGIRYARYGWSGIIPKIEVQDGIRILRTRE